MVTYARCSIKIVDLQLLIDPEGNITIIDPLEVLKSEGVGRQEKLMDILSNEIISETNPDFLRSLSDARSMLMRLREQAEKVANTTNVRDLKNILKGTPNQPAAKKSGNPLLRQAVGAIGGRSRLETPSKITSGTSKLNPKKSPRN